MGLSAIFPNRHSHLIISTLCSIVIPMLIAVNYEAGTVIILH